jgi:hypothetical protein
LNHIAKIVGNLIAESFPDNLAGILDGELYFSLAVPVGVDLETAFPDPFRVITVDGSDFKLVIDVEFFQSGPD